jgi:hypothetical protein
VTSENLAASQQSAELLHICDRLKAMGYAVSRRIRIYGEEFEVVSNPFPEGNGVAVRGISRRETEVRIVKLPLPILQAAGKRKAA